MSAYLVARDHGGAPLYSQIREALAKEIQDFFKSGDSLPPENDLAQRFGVNRHTLRRAIDELVADGLVERRHGRGVFVLEPAINYTISNRTRFTQTLQSQGKATESRILRKQVIPARESIASRLKITQGDSVAFLETLRRVENKPFCIISHFLPFNTFPEIIENYIGGSLHGFLKKHYGVEISRSESLISAILPNVDDASLLNMPRQTPVLRVKSINLDTNSLNPVEYAVTRFRGDATQLAVKPDPDIDNS